MAEFIEKPTELKALDVSLIHKVFLGQVDYD